MPLYSEDVAIIGKTDESKKLYSESAQAYGGAARVTEILALKGQ
jgi:hypothetical protein